MDANGEVRTLRKLMAERRQAETLRASSPEASDRLRRVRRRDTPAELRLRSALYQRGLRYRIDRRPVPTLRRKADLVFSRARVAVFVDGCFWHGCPRHMTWPQANAAWWRQKIQKNRDRDRDTDRKLRAAGWTVIRLWEHDDPEQAATRVADAVSQAS